MWNWWLNNEKILSDCVCLGRKNRKDLHIYSGSTINMQFYLTEQIHFSFWNKFGHNGDDCPPGFLPVMCPGSGHQILIQRWGLQGLLWSNIHCTAWTWSICASVGSTLIDLPKLCLGNRVTWSFTCSFYLLFIFSLILICLPQYSPPLMEQPMAWTGALFDE